MLAFYLDHFFHSHHNYKLQYYVTIIMALSLDYHCKHSTVKCEVRCMLKA